MSFYACAVLVYGVVSARTEEALELFIRREDAERFVEEVREDEPEARGRDGGGAAAMTGYRA